MKRFLQISILVLTSIFLKAQNNSVIDYPSFNNTTPNWIHLIIDSTFINPMNNGTDHLVSFIASPSILKGNYYHDVTFSLFNQDTSYITGFLYEELNLETGQKLFSQVSDLRHYLNEEIPILIDTTGVGTYIINARNSQPPNSNTPMLVFNGFSNFVLYRYNQNGDLIERRILNHSENAYTFLYPDNTLIHAKLDEDTVCAIRRYQVIDSGQPTFGYVKDKVDLNGENFFNSDTIYMSVDQSETSSVLLLRGRIKETYNKYVINHARISSADSDLNTIELLIINKSDFTENVKIDCKEYFSIPSAFQLHNISQDFIFVSNDENPDPQIVDQKLVVLDKSGQLTEEIPSLHNTKGYIYGGQFYPFKLKEMNSTFAVALNSENNSIDILKTDGAGTLSLVNEIQLENPSHFMALTDVMPFEEDNSLIIKGFLRKDTIIDNIETVVGRWHYIVSLDLEDIGIITSTKDLSNDFEVVLFPNPANSFFKLSFKEPISGIIQLFDIRGVLIGSKEIIKETDTELNISNLPTGMYFSKILSTEGVLSIPFIKIN